LEFLKENTGAFKTLSAHETFAIRKKHGDASVPVKGAFPIVFNINKLPELGDDAPAILSRMFINNFDVDFEAEGKAVKDYARKTFLEDKNTMPTLTGMVLAFAHYYSQPEHMWKESPSMKAELAALTDIATPQKRYVEWFKMFFDGYAGITLLKADYINFGKQEGEEYDTGKMTQSSLLFKQFKRRSQSNGTFYVLSETTYPVKRFTVSKNLYIRKYMGTMTWEEFQNDGNSLVHKMMLEYLSREEEYRKHLKLYLETKTDEEIKKKVLQDMWKEIIDEQRGAPYERQ
jgi:phage/plasmid-associated DNA primase